MIRAAVPFIVELCRFGAVWLVILSIIALCVALAPIAQA